MIPGNQSETDHFLYGCLEALSGSQEMNYLGAESARYRDFVLRTTSAALLDHDQAHNQDGNLGDLEERGIELQQIK